MTIIRPDVRNPSTNAVERQWSVITWASLTSFDEGEPVKFVPYADRSVQVAGIWGSDLAKVELMGSNDGVNFTTLRNPFNEPIVITQNSQSKLMTVVDICAYIKPVLLDGSGSDLTVSLLVKY